MSDRLPTFHRSVWDAYGEQPWARETLYPAPVCMYRKQACDVCPHCGRYLLQTAFPVKFLSFRYGIFDYEIMVHICERCDSYVYVPIRMYYTDGTEVNKADLLQERLELNVYTRVR